MPLRGGAVLGVLALQALEADRSARDYRITVTNPDGIVFMATDPGWLHRGLLPLTPDRLARIAALGPLFRRAACRT